MNFVLKICRPKMLLIKTRTRTMAMDWTRNSLKRYGACFTFVWHAVDEIIIYLVVFCFVQVLDGNENIYDYYGDSDLENVEDSRDSNSLNKTEVCVLYLFFMCCNEWHNYIHSLHGFVFIA